MRHTSCLAALLLFGVACAGGKTPAPPAQDTAVVAAPSAVDRATAAAAVANAIAATPAKADSILTAAGYNAESFQQLMYQIAADSAMSAAYAAARTK